MSRSPCTTQASFGTATGTNRVTAVLPATLTTSVKLRDPPAIEDGSTLPGRVVASISMRYLPPFIAACEPKAIVYTPDPKVAVTLSPSLSKARTVTPVTGVSTAD